MKPTDPFEASLKPTPTRSAIKRAVMTLHNHGLLPAAVLAWAFRVFRLRNA